MKIPPDFMAVAAAIADKSGGILLLIIGNNWKKRTNIPNKKMCRKKMFSLDEIS